MDFEFGQRCFVKTMFLILSLALPLRLPTDGLAEPNWNGRKTSAYEVDSTTKLRAKHEMNVVSVVEIVAEEKLLGQLVVYDDPSTQRPVDYIELTNDHGVVLAIAWFDRFGIERMVVDRGILEEKEQLEGVLVPVLTGIAV